jgi:hypothetical protein
VLVGTDGRWGDLMAVDEASAIAACEAASVTVAKGWQRELADSVRTPASERQRMGGNRRP